MKVLVFDCRKVLEINCRKMYVFACFLQRCEISNNAAERKAKAYATGRKNFLFHDTEDGAKASAVVMSLIETAKMNNLNVFQYLYVLLLYMPDYKDEPAGIEQLLPWSEFIKEKCSGVMDTENLTLENRGSLQI